MCDILNAIIEIGGTTAFEERVDPSFFTSRDLLTDRLEAFSHLVEAEGMVQGYQWISPYEGQLCQIATFARPGTTQRGMGSLLFPKTCETARLADYTEIDATIRIDNVGGLRYYEKMGFVDHGITREVPLGDGTLVDRVHKRYFL
ncbi:MAG: GNAT family N-acetyltransferase [Litoreibacter sp.]